LVTALLREATKAKLWRFQGPLQGWQTAANKEYMTRITSFFLQRV
jgi:hypothetical protein